MRWKSVQQITTEHFLHEKVVSDTGDETMNKDLHHMKQ